MAINSVSGASQFIPQQVNPKQTKVGRDADGDNDGTKPGQVEKANETGKTTEATKTQSAKQATPTTADNNGTNNQQPTTTSSGASGRNINVFA